MHTTDAAHTDEAPRTPRPTGTLTRRRFITRSVAAGAGLLATPVAISRVTARAPIVSTQTGDTPTTGALRPGPVGLNPPVVLPGVRPVAIRIDKIAVDAEVEEIEIVDGVMQNPTGPWVVSWYRETARLGQTDGNTVMAGHVDYWDVGPAVFWGIKEPGLAEGDEINVSGEDGALYTYEVEWQKTYTVADLTPEAVREIVGATGYAALTLVTCGGPFDYQAGEYLQRLVVRAALRE